MYDLVAAAVAAVLLVALTVGVKWYVGGFGGRDRTVNHPSWWRPPTR